MCRNIQLGQLARSVIWSFELQTGTAQIGVQEPTNKPAFNHAATALL